MTLYTHLQDIDRNYRTVITASGGMDSAAVACLHALAGETSNVLMVHVNMETQVYGGAPWQIASEKVADLLGIDLLVVENSLASFAHKGDIGRSYIPGYRLFWALPTLAAMDHVDAHVMETGYRLPSVDADDNVMENAEVTHMREITGAVDADSAVNREGRLHYIQDFADMYCDMHGMDERVGDIEVVAPLESFSRAGGIKLLAVTGQVCNHRAPMNILGATMTCHTPIRVPGGSSLAFAPCGDCTFCEINKQALAQADIK